jgi:hypothetical protein
MESSVPKRLNQNNTNQNNTHLQDEPGNRPLKFQKISNTIAGFSRNYINIPEFAGPTPTYQSHHRNNHHQHPSHNETLQQQTIIKKITIKKDKELLQQIKIMAINLETRLPIQKKDHSAGIKKISFKRVYKTVNKA